VFLQPSSRSWRCVGVVLCRQLAVAGKVHKFVVIRFQTSTYCNFCCKKVWCLLPVLLYKVIICCVNVDVLPLITVFWQLIYCSYCFCLSCSVKVDLIYVCFSSCYFICGKCRSVYSAETHCGQPSDRGWLKTRRQFHYFDRVTYVVCGYSISTLWSVYVSV